MQQLQKLIVAILIMKLRASILTANGMPDMKCPQYNNKLFVYFLFRLCIVRLFIVWISPFNILHIATRYSHYSLSQLMTISILSHIHHKYTHAHMLMHMMRMPLLLPLLLLLLFVSGANFFAASLKCALFRTNTFTLINSRYAKHIYHFDYISHFGVWNSFLLQN